MERETIRRKPFIYIANHPYKEDNILVMMALKRPHLKRPSKGFGTRIPVWSGIGRLTGVFSVTSGNGFELAKQYLLKGEDLLIFPQGKTTRDRDAHLHKGALELSLQTGALLVPIHIKSRFNIKVGEPFMPTPDEDIMEKVWELE